MPPTMTQSQLQHYQRDGFVFPLKAMDAEQALHYRSCLEAYEGKAGGPISALAPRTKYKMKTYLLCRWAYEIATNARILDAVEQIIGPDIMLLHGVLFIKEPHTPQVAAWHQDSVYFGVDPI